MLLNEIKLALDKNDHAFDHAAAITAIRLPVADARWSARMREKDIVMLRDILDRIRQAAGT